MQNKEQTVQSKLLEISQWAINAHSNKSKEKGGKFRKKSFIPYFIHTCEVTKRLSNYGINFGNKSIDINDTFNTLALGMCHDLHEDTTLTKEEMITKLGTDLFDLILMVTRPDGHETRDLKWKFLISFLNDDKHPISVLVKIADRFVNVMDYFNTDPHYASFYALQGFPLYLRFFEDTKIQSIMGKNIYYMINQDINTLSEIIRLRYNKHIHQIDLNTVEKEVT